MLSKQFTWNGFKQNSSSLLLLLLLLSLFLLFPFTFELWECEGLEQTLGMYLVEKLKICERVKTKCLPLTVMVMFSLIAVPIVLLTLHLYTNTPPVVIVMFQTPVLLTSFTTILPFTNNRYEWTAGLLFAEQLKVVISPWQTVVLLGTS